MSLRGINFDHRPGDYVLCFEPDPTKARVLYDAKIIELSVGRGSKGKRKPAYRVHFQGWNNSWDRVVPESLVLRSSEENRELKKHIASVARKIRKNSVRKRKIESILRDSLHKRPKFSSSSFESDTSQDSDSDSDDHSDVDDKQRENMTESEKNDESQSEDDMSEAGQTSDLEEEEEEEAPLREVEIPLSDNLKRKLEDDCYFIQRKRRLLKLPAEPNAIGILEGYVKNFGANLVCAETKHYPSRGERDKPPPTDKNLDLCKEVVDGLRIIFDFSLESKLLYDAEREHYEKCITNFSPPKSITQTPLIKKMKTEPVDEPVKTEHSVNKSRRRCKSQIASSHVENPSSSPPGSPTQNSSKHTHDINANTCEQHSKRTRRITRHQMSTNAPPQGDETNLNISSHQNTSSSSTNSHLNNSSHVDKDTPASHLRRRGSLRSSHHMAKSSDDDEITFKKEVPEVTFEGEGCEEAEENDGDGRVETSGGGAGGSHRSSHHSGNQTSESSLPSLVYQHGYRSKEAALNDIFSWKLVPEELYSQKPVPPSLICGAQHFLRLFVKLPEILSEMRISDETFRPLHSHILMLLEYMSNSHEELFLDTAYMDAL